MSNRAQFLRDQQKLARKQAEGRRLAATAVKLQEETPMSRQEQMNPQFHQNKVQRDAANVQNAAESSQNVPYPSTPQPVGPQDVILTGDEGSPE
jgi:hypothetical protein